MSQNNSTYPIQPALATNSPAKTLSIGLLNVTGLRNNYNLINQQRIDLGIDILFTTETWIYSANFLPSNIIAPTITDSEAFRRRPQAGVALVASPDLNISCLAIDHEQGRYNITECNGIVFALLYLPPSIRDNEAMTLLRQITDQARTFAKPVIILGDFNARHTRLGDRISSKRGRALIEWANSNHARHVNLPCPVTLVRPRREKLAKSQVDYIFIIPNGRPEDSIQILNPTVHIDNTNCQTEHCLITCEIANNTQTAPSNSDSKERIKLENLQIPAVYDCYSQTIEQAIISLYESLRRTIRENEQVDQRAINAIDKNFTQTIIARAKELLGTQKVNMNCQKVLNSKEIHIALAKLNAAQQYQRRYPSRASRHLTMNCLQELNQAMKQAKFNQKAALTVKSVGSQQSACSMSMKLNGRHGNNRARLPDDPETIQRTFSHFNKAFNNPLVNSPIQDETALVERLEAQQLAQTIFSPDVIQSILRTLPKGKAPGISGLSNELLTKSLTMAMTLGLMFQVYFIHGIIPDAWKEAKIVLIHKKGSPTV